MFLLQRLKNNVSLSFMRTVFVPLTSRFTVDYADLAIIDLAEMATPAGKAALAIQVRDAMREQGFFYVINHGHNAEQVCHIALYTQIGGLPRVLQTERMFDIADVPFAGVGDEEKQKYAGKMLQTGSYQGYKLRQYWVRTLRPLSFQCS